MKSFHAEHMGLFDNELCIADNRSEEGVMTALGSLSKGLAISQGEARLSSITRVCKMHASVRELVLPRFIRTEAIRKRYRTIR